MELRAKITSAMAWVGHCGWMGRSLIFTIHTWLLTLPQHQQHGENYGSPLLSLPMESRGNSSLLLLNEKVSLSIMKTFNVLLINCWDWLSICGYFILVNGDISNSPAQANLMTWQALFSATFPNSYSITYFSFLSSPLSPGHPFLPALLLEKTSVCLDTSIWIHMLISFLCLYIYCFCAYELHFLVVNFV